MAAADVVPCLVLQVITPWDVSGGSDGKVDYDKLISEVSRGPGHTPAACMHAHCSKQLHTYIYVPRQVVSSRHCSKKSTQGLRLVLPAVWCVEVDARACPTVSDAAEPAAPFHPPAAARQVAIKSYTVATSAKQLESVEAAAANKGCSICDSNLSAWLSRSSVAGAPTADPHTQMLHGAYCARRIRRAALGSLKTCASATHEVLPVQSPVCWPAG